MARLTRYFEFGEFNAETGCYEHVRRLLVCTSEKVRIELGCTMNGIRCTRSIWKDTDGVEYVCHAGFTEPLTLGYLSGHGAITRL